MISRIPHTTTPGDLPVLEQELSTHLSEVAARQHVPAGLELLDETSKGHRHEGALHVFWRPARIQGTSHAEHVVYFSCRVCVHGKRASGFLGVHRYELRLAAADDDDFCRW